MSKKDKKKRVCDDIDLAHGNTSSPNVLSDEELKMLSASRKESDRGELPHYDNSEFAKARRYAKKNKSTVVFVTSVVVLLVAVIAFLAVFLYRELAAAPSTADFTLTLGEDETIIKYKSAMKDDTLYLDIVPIARYTEIVVSGTKNTIKLTADDGSYVRFEDGQSFATVNGEKVRLEGKARIVLLDGDSGEKVECHIPFSFIQKLFSNEVEKGTPSVYVSYSDKTNKILFHKITYNDSGKALPISFSVDCFDILAN